MRMIGHAWLMLVQVGAATMPAPAPNPAAIQEPVPARPERSEPLRYDRKGRPMVAVRINGRGPFDMVVDTAAEASLIAPDLAAELTLPRLSDMTVVGVGASTSAASYGVDRLSSGLFDVAAIGVTALPNPAVTNARGIIGMDVVADRKLTFDREAATLSAAASGPPAPGFVAVKGHADAGGMLVVPVSLDGRTVTALVDSGAEGTIAGPALLDLLGWQPDDPRVKVFGTMRGAGGASAKVRAATIAAFRIGPVTFRNVPVVIAGNDGTGEQGEPAIILGSNLLNLLGAYAVDPKRGELQIRVPPQQVK